MYHSSAFFILLHCHLSSVFARFHITLKLLFPSLSSYPASHSIVGTSSPSSLVAFTPSFHPGHFFPSPLTLTLIPPQAPPLYPRLPVTPPRHLFLTLHSYLAPCSIPKYSFSSSLLARPVTPPQALLPHPHPSVGPHLQPGPQSILLPPPPIHTPGYFYPPLFSYPASHSTFRHFFHTLLAPSSPLPLLKLPAFLTHPPYPSSIPPPGIFPSFTFSFISFNCFPCCCI